MRFSLAYGQKESEVGGGDIVFSERSDGVGITPPGAVTDGYLKSDSALAVPGTLRYFSRKDVVSNPIVKAALNVIS